MSEFPNRKDIPDLGLLRPYFDKEGSPSVNVRHVHLSGLLKQPFDPNATIVKRCVLTVSEWMEIDRVSQRAIRYRMPFVGKLMEHKLFDEEPDWREQEQPWSITHSDCWYSMREIEEAQRLGGDHKCGTTMIEAASRRVGECLEKCAIGVPPLPDVDVMMDGMFGHHGSIKVKCPKLNQDNIHQVAKLMLLKAVSEGLTGPFMFAHGLDLDKHLDNDFHSGNGHEPPIFTNRQAIEDVVAVGNKHVKVLDVMSTPFLQDEFGLIQMTKDVVKVRIGQQPIVVQWTDDPKQLNFKVLAVMATEFSGKGILLAEQEK
jgi:hypothetical protein